MTIRFYLDVILLVNLAVDYLIVEIEKKLLKKKVKKARQLLSAFLGGLLATGFFVLRVENDQRGWIENPAVLGAVTMLASMVILGVIQGLAFPEGKKETRLRRMVYFYIFSFVIAGSILGLHSVIYAQKRIGLLELLGIVMLLCMMLPVLLVVLQGMKEEAELVALVTIRLGTNRIRGTGFWDSGNHLFTADGRRPVCIVREDWIRQYVEPKWVEKTKFRVAYHSLGNPDGSMWAITADELWLGEDAKRRACGEVVLAFAEPGFFSDEEIQIILNSSLKL